MSTLLGILASYILGVGVRIPKKRAQLISELFKSVYEGSRAEQPRCVTNPLDQPDHGRTASPLAWPRGRGRRRAPLQ